VFEASLLRRPVTFGGKSHFVRPVPATPGKLRPLRKSVVERFAALTREREKTSKIGDETYAGSQETSHFGAGSTG
ncbi:hypothetical protein, partial [Mesotoga sp.]|uniref:hypothetical protein n=1 Tax=Mesotoga sp. TaxID=2053577 RepID=UPI00356A3148